MLLSTSIASPEHPQVCTPAFDGCQLKYTVCPPDASRYHQEARSVRRGEGSCLWEYVPASTRVSKLIANNVLQNCGRV